MVLFCQSVYICELTFYCKKGLSLPTIYFMSYKNQYKLMDLKKFFSAVKMQGLEALSSAYGYLLMTFLM